MCLLFVSVYYRRAVESSRALYTFSSLNSVAHYAYLCMPPCFVAIVQCSQLGSAVPVTYRDMVTVSRVREVHQKQRTIELNTLYPIPILIIKHHVSQIGSVKDKHRYPFLLTTIKKWEKLLKCIRTFGSIFM